MLARMNLRPRDLIPLIALWLTVIAIGWPLLQRIPNGSDHRTMIDVGETQIVLNVWGTLHATGYPLYVITGNLLTAPLRALGMSGALAAAAVSWLWGALALTLLWAVMQISTNRRGLALGVLILFALTRLMWLHLVVAEIYTFGLLIVVGLFALALWPNKLWGEALTPDARLFWLALLGGIGVGHHRATIMVAPALLFAVWPILIRKGIVGLLWRSIVCVLIGLLGLLPYLYLPLRAAMGGAWVYGEPSTWTGFWDQFNGAEAARFIGLGNAFALVTDMLRLEVTLIGLLAGIIGLGIGIRRRGSRRAALMMTLGAVVSYGFHGLFYDDILAPLILQVTVALAFGWLWLAGLMYERFSRRVSGAVLAVIWGISAATLFNRHLPMIAQAVNDPRGLEVIALAASAPSGSTLMIPWGTQHFAVGYARDVAGVLPNITLVDHKADYTTAFEAGRLVVPEYVRYDYPQAWWQARLGAPVYPVSAAPRLVSLLPAPLNVADGLDAVPSINAIQVIPRLDCEAQSLVLWLIWFAPLNPLSDQSVFVHLLDANGAVIAQADRAAPVDGWRPLSTWGNGEVIYDAYRLPRLPAATAIRYGLYVQNADSTFENTYSDEVAVTCTP